MVVRMVIAIVALGLHALEADAQRPQPEDAWRLRVAAVERALDAGRFTDAHALLVAAERDAPALGSRVAARLRVRYALELADWPQLADLPVDLFSADDAALYWYARGLGAARAAWPGAQPEWIDRARDALSALESIDAEGGRASRVTIWGLSVRAAIAAAQEERDELELLVAFARDVEARLGPADVDPVGGPGALDHLAGDLWWQVSRHAEAAAAYGRAVAAGPENARRWLGSARALDAQGRRDEARVAARTFLERWAEADEGRPEVAEASAIANR